MIKIKIPIQHESHFNDFLKSQRGIINIETIRKVSLYDFKNLSPMPLNPPLATLYILTIDNETKTSVGKFGYKFWLGYTFASHLIQKNINPLNLI